VSLAYRDRVPRSTSSSLGRRILVYGVTGSGKSTAARRIAARTCLPLTLVDELTWAPGWVPVTEDEQRRVFSAVAAQDRWVLDTAYGSWLDVVLPRVDLVVGLDYPRWFSLQRVFRRSVMRATDKKPICNGNTESFRQMLGRDSIIRWHFRSFGRKRGRMRAWAADAEGPAVLLFRRSRDLEVWIDTLGDRSANGTTSPGAEGGTETR
jgi:adenylate kinase family enzyme